jgi:uncharacterized protein YbgA (DUF1722 family)
MAKPIQSNRIILTNVSQNRQETSNLVQATLLNWTFTSKSTVQAVLHIVGMFKNQAFQNNKQTLRNKILKM